MLKKHPDLSKNARHLYLAMRALSDGKTGELQIKGRWLKATVIDRRAEMCRDVRMRAMRELIAAGHVTMERARVCRPIDGRMRSFLGEAHYTVHRDPVPKNRQKAKDSSKVGLLKSISSTVVEIDSQFLPETPSCAPRSVLDLDSSQRRSSESAHRHHHQADEGDGALSNAFQSAGHVNTNGKNAADEMSKSKNKRITPLLRAWVDSRILARAGEQVRSRSAYLRASRAEFMENLSEEVEMFLLEKAVEYLGGKIEAAPQCPVPWKDIFNFLCKLCDRYALPIAKDRKLFERVARSATDELGLVETTG